VVSLLAGVALMHTTMVVVGAVATLFVAEATGAWWGGAPNTAAVLGAALGTLAISALMVRRGRRSGLRFGYAAAALGSILGITAISSETVLVIVPAMVLMGVGNAAAHLSRYAAADLYPPERRGFVVGAIVWAGTIGGVVGPLLIAPASELALAFDLPSFSGVFLVGLLMTAGAWLSMAGAPIMRPETDARPDPVVRDVRRARLMREPRARVAFAAMITGQFTMVAIMTMTPLHIHQHGRGLGVVGVVLSAHVLGMFALSPVTGWMTDRFGSSRTIVLGLAVLVGAALLTIVVPDVDGAALPISMFLLGYGWNLTHVGGSALLTHGLTSAEQTRLQGVVDSSVWAVSAVATLGSGAVFAIGGLPLLGVVGGGLVIYPAAVLAVRRKQLHAARSGYVPYDETG
jgi:MFS family permease